MTREEEEQTVERLLSERRRLARFGLQLSPDKLMLLERLLYRLGWTMKEKYARPHVPFTSVSGVWRNPRHRSGLSQSARTLQKLVAVHKDRDVRSLAASALQGETNSLHGLQDKLEELGDPHSHYNWSHGADFVAAAGPWFRGQHIDTIIRDPARDLDDVLENARKAQRHGIVRYFPNLSRVGSFLSRTGAHPKIAAAIRKYINQGGPLTPWERLSGDVAEDFKSDTGLSHVFARDGVDKDGKPITWVSLKRTYPMGGTWKHSFSVLADIPTTESTPMRRHSLPRRFAKVDGHEKAHPLIAGFPIEFALRHLANDPKNTPDVRDIASIALTGKNKATGEVNDSNVHSSLWALNDALQEMDHPLGSNKKGGYQWMSAADKVLLDRHTHTALSELANDVRRDHGEPAHNDDWNYTPEGQAMRVSQALGNQKHHAREVAARNTLMLNRVRSRVAELSPGSLPEHVDESVRRHAHRALHVWRTRHGLGATEPGERRVVDKDYTDDATVNLKERNEKAEKKADDSVYQSMMNRKATRYAKRYNGIRKFSHWAIPAGFGSGRVTPSTVEVWEHRPVRSNKGQWIWGGALSPRVGHNGVYSTREDAEESLGQRVHDPGTVAGTPLTPQEIWAHTDGKEGEAPALPEQDWRPDSAMPEDYHTSRKGARPRRYARLGPARAAKTHTGEQVFHHGFADDTGKPLGTLSLVPRGDALHVHWVGLAGAGSGEQAGAAGAGHMRSLLPQIAQAYPQHNVLIGRRTGGAHQGENRGVELGRFRTKLQRRVIRYSHKAFQDAIHNNELDRASRGVYADWLEEHAPETASHTVLHRLRHHEGRLWVGMSKKGKVLAIPRVDRKILADMAAKSPWGVPSGDFYHSTSTNSKGQAHRVRASGKMQTWKRDPDRFRVPWKHGLYDNGEFTQRNSHEFLVEDPTAEPVEYHDPKQMRRKYAKKQLTGTFIDALRRAAATNSDALKSAGEKIARQIGAWPTKTFSAVHDSPRGATPGVAQVVYGRTTPEQVHALGAWVGLVGNLPGVSVFHNRDSGPDYLHRVRASGSGMELRTRLDRVGIRERVLVPHGRGFDVLVPDKGGRMIGAVEEFAKRHGGHVESSRGHFNTVGSTDQAQARDTFRNTVTRSERMSRKRPIRYATNTQDFLTALQRPEYAAHMAGLDDPVNGLRGVAADHMDEQGRSEEANYLRTPGLHVVVHQGRVLPNYMERQVSSSTYGGQEDGEQFVKPTHDGWRGEEDGYGPDEAHHGFTYWFATHSIPRDAGMRRVGNKHVWWWNPADGEGFHPDELAEHHPDYEKYQKTDELHPTEPVLMTPAEIAWMKHHAKTPQFKRG